MVGDQSPLATPSLYRVQWQTPVNCGVFAVLLCADPSLETVCVDVGVYMYVCVCMSTDQIVKVNVETVCAFPFVAAYIHKRYTTMTCQF